MRHLTLELAGYWMGPGLVVEMDSFGKALSLISIPWSHIFSGDLISWTQSSHLRVEACAISGAPRLYKPHSTEEKEKERKKIKQA